jgi:hypothetical protein
VNTVKLLRYQDFLDRVEELGFMAFSGIVDGLPSLTGETPMNIWHTGDPESDPCGGRTGLPKKSALPSDVCSAGTRVHRAEAVPGFSGSLQTV